MGKFTNFDTTVRSKKPSWDIHPAWRGIGCLIMVLIPIMSYAGAVLLVDANFKYDWIPFPPEFFGPPGQPLLYSQLGVTLLLTLFSYFFLVIIYSIMYRFFGPPKYKPTDAPPARRRKVRSK